MARYGIPLSAGGLRPFGLCVDALEDVVEYTNWRDGGFVGESATARIVYNKDSNPNACNSGDPVPGTSFIDALAAFEADPETEAVVLIGEIGGTAEEEAAEYVKNNLTKSIVSYIAGVTAPPGKKMGHAGAIISGGKGTADEKIAALREAGIEVADSPADMAQAVLRAIDR